MRTALDQCSWTSMPFFCPLGEKFGADSTWLLKVSLQDWTQLVVINSGRHLYTDFSSLSTLLSASLLFPEIISKNPLSAHNLLSQALRSRRNQSSKTERLAN